MIPLGRLGFPPGPVVPLPSAGRKIEQYQADTLINRLFMPFFCRTSLFHLTWPLFFIKIKSQNSSGPVTACGSGPSPLGQPDEK